MIQTSPTAAHTTMRTVRGISEVHGSDRYEMFLTCFVELTPCRIVAKSLLPSLRGVRVAHCRCHGGNGARWQTQIPAADRGGQHTLDHSKATVSLSYVVSVRPSAFLRSPVSSSRTFARSLFWRYLPCRTVNLVIPAKNSFGATCSVVGQTAD